MQGNEKVDANAKLRGSTPKTVYPHPPGWGDIINCCCCFFQWRGRKFNKPLLLAVKNAIRSLDLWVYLPENHPNTVFNLMSALCTQLFQKSILAFENCIEPQPNEMQLSLHIIFLKPFYLLVVTCCLLISFANSLDPDQDRS